VDLSEIKQLMDERDELAPVVRSARVHIEEQKAALEPLEARLSEIEIALINEYDRRKA
jgi:hypothetical protein